jgi:2-epi-5-epi-valiolone synthase
VRDLAQTGLAPSATSAKWGVSSSSRLTESSSGDVLWLGSSLHRTHQVTFARRLLSPANAVLRDCIASRRALVVVSPTVHRLYGRQILGYFAAQPAHPPIELMVLHRAEASKTLDAAIEVCERAAAAGLHRTSPIVAIGGGVCSDISGLAAALHRRGVPHINVPTTLVGLIDAGIGTKNAVNHGSRKSALGSFYPPEHSILDIGFLASLPRRHFANGLAEIIKLAIVSDEELFDLLADSAPTLIETGFRSPASAAERTIRLAVTGMLSELARNLYEIADFRRRVDFGHTFSPYYEVASGHSILHGEAVAMDLALSSQIARELGLLAEEDLDRILSLIRAVGLSLTWPRTNIDKLWATLSGIVEHRDGDLHLVVPHGIGSCQYLGIETISPQLLRACTDRLARWSPEAPLPSSSLLNSVRV